MTLRELLKSIDRDKFFRLVNKRDRGMFFENPPSMERTIQQYTKLLGEFLNIPNKPPYNLKLYVENYFDLFTKSNRLIAGLLNPKYIGPPPKGLKPWGCKKGQEPPKGYYNVNSSEYNKTFGLIWTPWSKIIDTEIVNKSRSSNEKIAAEILRELTFEGWTERTRAKNIRATKKLLDERAKEFERGEYVELSDVLGKRKKSKKKGKYKVMACKGVLEDLKKIFNKKK